MFPYKERIHNFFNRGSERSVLTKKNIFASFGVKGITIFVSLALFPLTIDYLDPERYGIWNVLNKIVALMVIFDVGFGNGLKNKYAEAKANGDMQLVKRYVSSTYAIMTLLGIGILIVFAFVNPHINWNVVLNTQAASPEELNLLMWISMSSFLLIFVLRLLTSIVSADQRPAIAGFIDMLGQVLSLIGIFLLVKFTPSSLTNLMWVLSYSPVVIYVIATIVLFTGRYKEVRPSLRCVNLRLAKQMMNLGLKFFVASCAAFIISGTLNILISNTSGTEAVTVYEAAFKIFSQAFSIMAIVFVPYWTSFTDAYVLKDFAWMQQSLKKLRKLYIYFLAVQVLLLALSPILYKMWFAFSENKLEVPFAMSLAVFIYLCVWCWTNLHIYPINGIGKIKLQLYSSIVELILFVPVAFLMSRYLGVIGVILTPALLYIPRMIWSPIQLNKLLKGTAKGIWNE